MKLYLGNAAALRMVEAPCKQTMSANRATRFRPLDDGRQAPAATRSPDAREAGAEEALGAAEQAMLCAGQPRAFARAEVSTIWSS